MELQCPSQPKPISVPAVYRIFVSMVGYSSGLSEWISLTDDVTAGARRGPAVGGNFNLNHRRQNFAAFIDYSITRSENQAATSALTNNVLVQRMIDHLWTIDTAFTSYSNIYEKIGAVYFSIKWLLAATWQINGGLRYEYTQATIRGAGNEKSLERKYSNIFPNFSSTKELAPEQDIQFSYGRSITRPTYNDIASFAAFWSPNTFTAGNASLWPALSDAIRIGYHLKHWTISMQWTHVKNEIVSLQPEVNRNSNTLIYPSQNLSFSKLLSLTNFWAVQTSHIRPTIPLDKYGLNINLVNVWKLSKDLSIEVSGYFQSSQGLAINYSL